MDVKELRARIKAANEDIMDRVKEGSFRLQYDSDGDIFYFALTDYTPTAPVISLEDADPEETSYLRVEDGTYRVIGFDILAWREVHLRSNPRWQKAFELLLKAIGEGDFKLEFDPDDDDPIRLYYVPNQVDELLAAA